MRQRNGSAVIDCDGHVIEPWDMWEQYIAEPFKQTCPRMQKDEKGIPRLAVEGRLYPKPSGPGRAPLRILSEEQIPAYESHLVGGHDPEVRIQHMDKDGIDIALLLPSQGLVIGSIADPALAAASARAYNNWLSDYCRYDPDRLLGAAVLPLQDVNLAIDELTYAVDELGVRAVYMRPNPVNGRTLADPAYVSLYEHIEKRSVPILIHEGCGFASDATVAIERFENGMFSHMISHPFEQMIACLTLIAGGVLERFPGLRVGFLESGCGWVPYWLNRMDEHYELFRWEVAWLKKRPSEYFREQCVIGFEAAEEALPLVVATVGEDNVIFGSDYPHSDHVFPSVAAVRKRHDISERVKRKLLGLNAERLLNLHLTSTASTNG